MKKNQQQQVYWVAGVIIVVILIAAGFFKMKSSSPETTPTSNLNLTTKPTPTPPAKGQDQPGVWFGTLKTSDNAAKGNLMLVTKDRTIYLKTSRDFSQLLGKDVYVTYEGDLNGFVLGDISQNQPQ